VDNERQRYKPSGRIFLPFFLPLSALVYFSALVVGIVLSILFFSGYYFVGVAAFVAGLLMAGLVFGAARFGRCRNPWAALFLGASAGLLVYVFHYYVCMVAEVGVFSPSLLPDYIAFRMENDVLRDAVQSEDTVPTTPAGIEIAFNWFLLGVEALALMAIPAWTGWAAARRLSAPHDRHLSETP